MPKTRLTWYREARTATYERALQTDPASVARFNENTRSKLAHRRSK